MTTPMHEFFADISMLVTDANGSPFLQPRDADPMSSAMLPAGKYHLTMHFHGQPDTREVTLDGKHRERRGLPLERIRGCQIDMRRRSATP